MSHIAISAEHISKKYNLGTISSGTLFRDLNMYWAKMRGKPNPYASVNDTGEFIEGEHWALNDVSFDIKQGDAVGIIGKNGAGKSTLLKILSRVTTPTSGHIKIKGRIASLLEVGTGFHPEMTGRENIFLNGAILGMNKAEIRKKLDEIVDFAGIEKYIDTPVKRYSSGMYVRLAFGVAAHLEPEILIVDEVLAVGDADFQKKCLGKMNDVSKNEGRTVLFVSHNMGAVNQLCTKGILLKQGQLAFAGTAEKTVREYLKISVQNGVIQSKSTIGTLKDRIAFKKITLNNFTDTEANIKPAEPIKITVHSECLSTMDAFRLSLSIYKDGIRILTAHDATEPYKLKKGDFESSISVPAYLLRPGDYLISIGGHCAGYENSSHEWLFAPDVYSFTIIEEWDEKNDFNGTGLINLITS